MIFLREGQFLKISFPKIVFLFLNVISSKLQQFINAPSPIFSTFLESEMLFIERHPSKAKAPISFIPLEKSIFLKKNLA